MTQMTQEKEKVSKRHSTVGESLYAVVHKPQVDKNYPTNPDGSAKKPVYRVTVKYKAEDPELKKLKDVMKTYKIKKKLRELDEDEDGNPTAYSFTFEKVSIKDKETGQFIYGPQVVDRNNKTIPKDVLIGNGSKINLVYQVREYVGSTGPGHTLQLLGIQVLELIEYSPPPMFTPIDNDPPEYNDTEGLPSSF